jgi:superoxide reductase
MAERGQVLVCESDGLIVEVLRGTKGEASCCGAPMKRVKANTSNGTKEKHVPVIERVPGGFKVSIGAVPHPMEEKHFIEWIELIGDEVSYRSFLSPGKQPSALFMIDAARVAARGYCNIHGMWRGEA